MQTERNVKENQSSGTKSQKNKTKSACNAEEFTVNNKILKEVVKYCENILFTHPAVKAPLVPRFGFPLLISLSLPVGQRLFFRKKL